MVVLVFLEWLKTDPTVSEWVYEVCDEMPIWDVVKRDYVFKHRPKRITADKAKEIIEEHGLKCVCNNKHGRIYK